MARLFPFRSDPDEPEGHPRVVDLEGDEADAVFSALSSTTARRIYARLEAEPGTPSDVADAIDSSIQNVRYHLENLEEAGLIEVVDTWYSSRGNEMSVYAATDGPLIVTSDESTASRLREALSRFLGGIGALAGASLLVQYGLVRWAESAADSSSAGGVPADTEREDETGETDGGDGADDSSETDETDETTGADSADETSGTAETDADGGAGVMDDSSETESDDATDDVGAQSAEQENYTGEGSDVAADDLSVTDGNKSVEAAADGGAETVEAVFAVIPPGLLFFLGGLVVLSAVTIYWYWLRPTY
ncbi:ArsR/SmtB family transcription factor [Natronorubrum aibiense]|uniref:Helix-turn-helix domain-containing protein n=1 Tax=Natronorubrum aibiense TaxID=348826 RepID=A0A5P9P3D3_9EURY|nr:helix-turn-helix domain-containing protein [Natronorubrum aibiense]QFU82659.1 helix-turn-helix domain-containing protein [Natronorubrum aibiense]